MLQMERFKLIALAAGFVVMAIAVSAAPLEIDPQQSKIEVAVSCTMDSFVGHLEKFQATIDCDPTASLPTKANVSFDFADLKTGDKDRDLAMLKWLGCDTNRTASFHLTSWSQTGTTDIAQGELKIHGVTVGVQMPVVVQHDATAWDISGQTVIDCKDFNLPKIRKALILTVNPKLKVKFHLMGKMGAVE